MSKSKDTRASEYRITQQQIKNFKRTIGQASNDPLAVIGADPRYDYYWFASLVGNQINHGRLEQAAARNWEPVKVTDMPQMALSLHSLTRDVKTALSDFITRDGCSILHRRLKEWAVIEEEMRKKQNQNREREIARASGFVGDSSAKVTHNSKRAYEPSRENYEDYEDDNQAGFKLKEQAD